MATVTLDQLIALNREISALATAGVPLSEGLVRIASEASGAASELSLRLAGRIESGMTLPEAVDAEGDQLPKSYRVLVHAGNSSGRLAAALEGYATTADRMSELRRVVGLASIYPILLLVTIWILFLMASRFILPQFDWLEIGDKIWVQPFRTTGIDFGFWGNWFLVAVVPIAIVCAAWVLWRRSASAMESAATGSRTLLNWIPGIARIRRLSCEANFADLLRLFVEQQIPMTTALPLAAEASGVEIEAEEIRRTSEQLKSGQPPRESLNALRKLPALIRLALLTSRGPEDLQVGLQRAAVNYQQRAQDLSRSVTLYLPILVTGLVGGTSVAIYAVLLLQPYIATLQDVVTW